MSVLRQTEAWLQARLAKKADLRPAKASGNGKVAKGAQKPRKSRSGAFKPHSGSKGEIAFAAQLEQAGITGWVREYRFAPPKRWRFDFAWPEKRFAVEIEGAIWSQGRHSRGSGVVGDMEKYNAAALAGWVVLRFTTEQAESGFALDTVRMCV
jgi:very-short-patch-repair endonuclease